MSDFGTIPVGATHGRRNVATAVAGLESGRWSQRQVRTPQRRRRANLSYASSIISRVIRHSPSSQATTSRAAGWSMAA